MQRVKEEEEKKEKERQDQEVRNLVDITGLSAEKVRAALEENEWNVECAFEKLVE